MGDASPGCQRLRRPPAIVIDVAWAMLPTPDTPSRIGKYEIQGRLGAGGFATVWAASTRDGEEVALKVLAPRFIEASDGHGPSIADRFLQEARMLQRFDHPGVVRILDIIGAPGDDLIAYVMEKLAGRDLKALRDEIELSTMLEVFAQAADILHQVHLRDILHRDVKLSNIFVCDPPEDDPYDRQVKLIDFGIAKDLADEEMLARTAHGHFLGTFHSTPPECYLRLDDPSIALTPAVDQWGLAVALYQALSGGLRPFRARAPAVAGQIVHDAPTPLTMAARFEYPEVPEDIARILKVALRKQPSQRYPDLATMADALRTSNANLTAVSQPADLRALLANLETSKTVQSRIDAAPPERETLLDLPVPELPTQQLTLGAGDDTDSTRHLRPPTLVDKTAQLPNPGRPGRSTRQPSRPRPSRAERPPAKRPPAKPGLPLGMVLLLSSAGAVVAFVLGSLLAR